MREVLFMRCLKIISCIALIFFAATMSGCRGAGSFFKSAVKDVGKVAQKLPNAAKRHADDVAEIAYDMATTNNTPQSGTRPTSGRTSRLAGAGAAMVGGAAVANELLSDHWIRDLNSDAYVWNPEPQDGESVRWSGDFVDEDGTRYAQGRGTLTWYKNGEVIQTDEGSFDHGRHHGQFRHTFRSGRVDYSNWDHGREIPLENSASDDSAEQTFRNYYRAITDGNYREAYDTLSNAQKQRMGDFNSYVSGFSTTISGEVIDLRLVSSDADSRTYDYTVKARDRDRGRVKVSIFKGQVTMAKDRGRWFVRHARSSKTDDWYE